MLMHPSRLVAYNAVYTGVTSQCFRKVCCFHKLGYATRNSSGKGSKLPQRRKRNTDLHEATFQRPKACLHIRRPKIQQAETSVAVIFLAPRIPQTLTYLLTPWSRAPLEKLTGSAANQEIPRIFGTRRFLTVPTSARHPSLS